MDLLDRRRIRVRAQHLSHARDELHLGEQAQPWAFGDGLRIGLNPTLGRHRREGSRLLVSASFAQARSERRLQ